MTLVGHSLGTYVSSEIAAQFGKVKNIVALDPAFPGKQRRITSWIPGLSKYNFDQKYDLDGRTSKQDVPRDFRDVAHNSLAFVAKNSFNGGGMAGDNVMATTADNSFVVDFGAGFEKNNPEKAIGVDHNNVVNVFTSAVNRGFLSLPNLNIPKLEKNWYINDGIKNLDSKEPGPAARGEQEGVISVRPASPKNDDKWPENDPNASDNPVHITGLTRVVDSSGKEKRTWT